MSAKIAIIMGSDSDYLVMKEVENILSEFKIEFQTQIISAHRTPDKLVDFAKNALSSGIKIIIAGAGGAAHLPGMVAAISVVPVIGVPIVSKNLNGLDSLYSIVQMPPGVPVATMAINGSKNAALMAIQILALSEPSILTQFQEFRNKMEQKVLEKSIELFQV